uniref:(northern house mosquito) hypothetical protein n=1 Tax=Culex pipiens TaxID=7175 RepID=A0A8D8GXZ0_CULPI
MLCCASRTTSRQFCRRRRAAHGGSAKPTRRRRKPSKVVPARSVVKLGPMVPRQVPAESVAASRARKRLALRRSRLSCPPVAVTRRPTRLTNPTTCTSTPAMRIQWWSTTCSRSAWASVS